MRRIRFALAGWRAFAASVLALCLVGAYGASASRVVPADTQPTPTEYPIPTPNSGAFQITAGPDGNFWFCESRSNKIGRVTTAGVFTEFPLAGNAGPYGITSGSDGNMWITEVEANKIARMKPDGSSFTEFPIPTAGSRPSGITAGPDGNIWFAESEGNKIGRVTPSGVFTEFALPFPGSVPFQLTPGPDGNVWGTLFSASNIVRITSSGSITQFEIPTVNCEPSGITAGPDGNLFFTEFVGNKIGRITPSGVFTEFPISTPNRLPFGITVGEGGRLYTTYQGADQIGQFDTASQSFGSTINVSAGPTGITSLPVTGGNFILGYLATDANKLGELVISIPLPAIAFTVEVSPDSQKVGALLTYTFTIENNTNSDDNFVIADPLPDCLAFSRYSFPTQSQPGWRLSFIPAGPSPRDVDVYEASSDAIPIAAHNMVQKNLLLLGNKSGTCDNLATLVRGVRNGFEVVARASAKVELVPRPDLQIASVQQPTRKEVDVIGSYLPAPALLSSQAPQVGGFVILLNGEEQKTQPDDQNPTTTLIAPKAGKKIGRGDTVEIRVKRLSDGAFSNVLNFTRPQ